MQKLKNWAYRWLRWSEKYTKTDMVYLTRGSFWLSLNQAISALLAFSLSLFFANLMTKETYGTYKYILLILSLLAIPTLNGMGAALTQAAARGREKLIRPALQSRMSWGTAGSLLSLLASSYYFFFADDHVLGAAFLVAAAFVPIMDSLLVYDPVLQGRKDFRRSAIFSISHQLFTSFVIVIALLWSPTVFPVLLAYLVSTTLIRLILLTITLKDIPRESDEEELAMVSYGKHLSIMSIFDVLATQIGGIILFNKLGAPELAIYTFAMAIPDQIKNLFKTSGNLFMPKFSEKGISGVKAGVKKQMWPFLALMALVYIAYFAAAPLIYKTFFPQYIQSIAYSQAYALVLLLVPKVFYRVAFESQKMKKNLYIFQVFGFITTISTMAIFINYFGVWGAIWANIATETLIFLVLAYLFKFSFEQVR